VLYGSQNSFPNGDISEEVYPWHNMMVLLA
jgi:hypothetical protein